MKPPPLLLGAALVFWGWQTGFEIAGIVMASIIEAPRWIKARWDFSDEDFTRIWTFCTLLFLATLIYAFTANEGPSHFRSFLRNPNLFTERNAGTATGRTAAAIFRWLPMMFFLFVAAQVYSSRSGVPIETISLILRRRWRRARKAGLPIPPGRTVDVSYYYFGMCLLAAGVHTSEGTTYFWGLCALLGWALWPQRSRRFGPVVWAVCLGAAVGVGYLGQHSLGQLQSYLGNLNPWWLGSLARSRFDPMQSRTELGKIGRLKASGKVVIRLEATEGAPPPLLREASYRTYKGQTWYADVTDPEIQRVSEEVPNNGTYVLLRAKTNTLKANIGCYLDGGKALLPLPPGVGRLENLTAFNLTRSPLGAVFVDGPGVVVFNAHYGPGATIDSPPDLQQDLVVPSREQPALEETISRLKLTETNQQQILKALNNYFVEKFSYSVWQPSSVRIRSNETPLTRFLLRTHYGHCEYFATAGVLLLRQLNIPARYAVGYAVHENSGSGKFVVRQRDAHAWCLVWDERRNAWRDVDFTPPSWVQVEAARNTFQAFSDFWSRIAFELSKFRWGQTHLREYLFWAVAPILLALLYQIIFRSRRRQAGKHRQPSGPVDWPGLDSDFYRLEHALAQQGLPRAPNEPLLTWLLRINNNPAIYGVKEQIRNLLLLHYRYRFDPRGITASERQTLSRQVSACLEGLRST